jgi:hypothetical protein
LKLYGSLFLVMALALSFHALQGEPGPQLLFLWPSTSFALVGVAYLRFGPGMLGKRRDGSRNPLSTLLFLPYILTARAVWVCLRVFRRENAWDRVHDTLTVGRRLLGRELPDHIDHVLDLTTEMLDPKAVRAVAGYRAHPTLDGTPPPDDELLALATETAALDGVVYVHCAEGHGRASTLAAAILLAQGRASTVDEAIAQVKAARPKIRPTPAQRRALERLRETLG